MNDAVHVASKTSTDS